MRSFNKLFVIALPRCATVSLCDALGAIGVRTAHLGRIYGETSQMHHDPARLCRMHEQIVADDFQLEILRHCSGLADYPACSLDVLRRLDREYPGSLFINVRRDAGIERWLQSVERQFVGLQLINSKEESSEEASAFFRVVLSFRTMTFGQSEFNAEVYLKAYHDYQAAVAAHFANRPDDLLTISDVSELETRGFETICGFLHDSPPNKPFPRSNRHSQRPYRAFMQALADGRVQSQTGIEPRESSGLPAAANGPSD